MFSLLPKRITRVVTPCMTRLPSDYFDRITLFVVKPCITLFLLIDESELLSV